jgi:hypothetical protein
MKSVFISYSHEDKEFARKLASDLAARGIRTWLDETEIKVGDSIVQRIEEGIRQSDYILVILSENSIHSTWVQQEIRATLSREVSGANQILIPVVIGEVKLPPFLSHKKYVDLSKPSYYEKGIEAIVRSVYASTEESKPKPTELANVRDLAKEVAKEVAQILTIDPQGKREANPSSKHSDPKLVFVIISFSPDMEPIFEGIQGAGDHHGLRVERVKDVIGDYRITDKVIEMIHQARLIVADLTHERPNVYFELGFARGLGKTVITTAREDTKLHFDVKDWTCTFYNDSRVLERHLRERFAFELGKH